jgi:deoxyribodipyrimidine photolyase-related protein
MATLRLVLGDQLNDKISSLQDCDKENDIIFMCEVRDEATYVKHHKKKIAFLFSAMRHFRDHLTARDYNVIYYDLNEGFSSFSEAIESVLKAYKINKITVTSPGEWRVLEEFKSWYDKFDQDIEILEDDRFLATHDDFNDWAEGRKELRMEYFYREMRKKHVILLTDDGKPVDGQWNFDKDNRETLPDDITLPDATSFQPDDITKEVLDLVADKFGDHFGDLEPFHFAVTREEALRALNRFIEERLPNFGDYQDAMKQGEPFMYHSLLGAYINAGLLLPLEVIEKAEMAYYDGHAPINAVEGFIRQILGWREYVRGIYWRFMPDYASNNFLQAQRALPDFFWTGDTKMNCLKQSITETKENAYAHHIQRLMVLGNFCLIAGINPEEVNAWYLIVYADAYEWVELPNVSGMVLFADGGVLASKPYAASGSYIDKMSDYCKNCSYNVKDKTGETACPFNYLYWDFLSRNEEKLKDNHRLRMIYSSWNRMNEEKRQTIQSDAAKFLESL